MLKWIYFFLIAVCFVSLADAESLRSAKPTQNFAFNDYKKALVGVKKSISMAAYRNPETVYKSGFICDKKRGWVITVITSAESGATVATYELTLSGGQKIEAHCLYKDPLIDIEVLVFDPKKVFGEIYEITRFSQALHLDTEVFLLSKNGEQEIVQKSTISSLYETVRPLAQQVLRVSLNTPGTTLGSVGILKDGSCSGIVLEYGQTFARLLRSDYLRGILTALSASKKPKRTFLKDAYITTASLADAARYTSFPETVLTGFLKRYPEALAQGLMISDAMPGSVFQPGDILWSIDGKEIGPSLCAFQERLNEHSGRSSVSIKIYRDGQEKVVKASLDDAWSYVINKMILFGGALFYESDLLGYRVYNIPLKSLTVSKVLPGSVFDSVFPAFPINGLPIFYACIHKMATLPVTSLSDLLEKMPRIAVSSHFAVLFQDYGCGVRADNMLTVNRAMRVTYIDFIASTSIPELLTWSDATHRWKAEPITLTEQKCLIQ